MRSGVDWSSKYAARLDVPPKPLTSWTTSVMTCPVDSPNCTIATDTIILYVDVSD